MRGRGIWIGKGYLVFKTRYYSMGIWCGFIENDVRVGFWLRKYDLWESLWETRLEGGNWVGFCWWDWVVENSVGK